jgi:hypothetical protein
VYENYPEWDEQHNQIVWICDKIDAESDEFFDELLKNPFKAYEYFYNNLSEMQLNQLKENNQLDVINHLNSLQSLIFELCSARTFYEEN